MQKLLAVLVGLWALNVQATELVLKEGDVIDLGAAPAGQRVFEFDKVRMASHSLILVPSSYRNVEIRINELTTDGVAYLYVYKDSVLGTAPPRPRQAGLRPACASQAKTAPRVVRGTVELTDRN